MTVPRRQAGDRRAYERVETEPGLDHYIKDSKGVLLPWTVAGQIKPWKIAGKVYFWTSLVV